MHILLILLTLCLRKLSGVSHLFSIAYAFIGNGCFACWTLDRLEAYLNEEKKIPIKRSRIDELLIAEGLRWATQETWFGERVDPEFAKKRGALKRSTPNRLRIVR